jgi:hypothetical protein
MDDVLLKFHQLQVRENEVPELQALMKDVIPCQVKVRAARFTNLSEAATRYDDREVPIPRKARSTSCKSYFARMFTRSSADCWT